LKGDVRSTIPAKIGIYWFSGFRGEDINVKAYDIRQMDRRWNQGDGNSSHGLWPSELKSLYGSKTTLRNK